MTVARASPLLERLGARHPIILAPMFGGSGPDLQAAVANAGGFAFFPCGSLPSASVRAGLKAAREKLVQTAAPVGANIWASAMIQENTSWSIGQAEASAEAARRQAAAFEEVQGRGATLTPTASQSCADAEALVEEQVSALIEEGVNVVSVHFGWLSSEQVKRFLAAGVYLIGNATNVAEARFLEHAGACAIIAQGAGAGGHRGTFLDKENFRDGAMIGTEQLVRDVVSAVSLPVIAAGGIMSGADVQTMFTAGAQAAMLGTAFLTAHESIIHVEHRRALLLPSQSGHSTAVRTVLTQAFTGKPARAIANRWTDEMDELQRKLPNCFNGLANGRPLAGAAGKANRTDLMMMWAGENFAHCRELPAAEIVAAIAGQEERPRNVAVDDRIDVFEVRSAM